MLAKYLNIKTLHLNYTFICFSYSGCFDHKKKNKKKKPVFFHKFDFFSDRRT